MQYVAATYIYIYKEFTAKQLGSIQHLRAAELGIGWTPFSLPLRRLTRKQPADFCKIAIHYSRKKKSNWLIKLSNFIDTAPSSPNNNCMISFGLF